MTMLYGLENCDRCRKARNWLDRFGIPHTFTDYRAEPQTPATLLEWKEPVGGWDLMINKSSTTWRNLPPHRKAPASDADRNACARSEIRPERRRVEGPRDFSADVFEGSIRKVLANEQEWRKIHDRIITAFPSGLHFGLAARRFDNRPHGSF